MHNATDQWSVFEASVQAYRALSLTAQGFYLAVGAILLGTASVWAFWAVGLLAALTTWWLFFPVIYARAAIVDFHKFTLGESLGADGTLHGEGSLDEKEYGHVTNWKLRRVVHREARRQMLLAPEDRVPLPTRTLRHTRMKLDVAMPLMFQLTWVVLGGAAVG